MLAASAFMPRTWNLLFLTAVLSAFSPLILSQSEDTNVRPAHSAVKTYPCMIQPDRDLVRDCINKDSQGKLFIPARYVQRLKFDETGLATVWSQSPQYGWMYVDNKGRVLVTGVAPYDNWADAFHDGLVRIMRRGKFGFANRAGSVVIPAVYDSAGNFDKGSAVVCQGCKKQKDCHAEHCPLIGGQWVRIDQQGRVVERLKGPV